MIKTFRDMQVWQKAHELSIEVFNITKNLPRSEDYALTSQIRESSNSASSNIAEGFGRRSKKDKKHFYTISRGSAFETQNHLLYGNAVEYFADEITDYLLDEYDDLIFQLNKIMKSLN
jgi:four helix bundle protein